MTDVMANFGVYEKIEKTAKKIAKPWQYTAFLLGFLLLLSVCGNIYLATQNVDVVVDNNASFSGSNNNVNEVRGK